MICLPIVGVGQEYAESLGEASGGAAGSGQGGGKGAEEAVVVRQQKQKLELWAQQVLLPDQPMPPLSTNDSSNDNGHGSS